MSKKHENYISLLRDLLKTKGWTQDELARQLDVTFASLSRWLNGHVSPQPSRLTLIKKLHREHVGFKSIGRKDYQYSLKRAESFRIKDIRGKLQKCDALARELIVDFTYNSNTMEGTTLTFRETEALLYDHVQASNRPFLENLVVSNHAAILKDILSGHYKLPITEAMIHEIHARLFQGVRDDPGVYSRHQRGITGLNIALTHPEDIPEEMERLLKKRAVPKKSGSVEAIAQFHTEFELIHPFGEGNGRVGRLLMLIQLLENDYPPVVIENKRKSDYYETLEEAQRRSHEHLTQFLVEEMERAYKLVKKYI